MKLSEQEREPLRDLAAAEHGGNLSAAARAAIARWAEWMVDGADEVLERNRLAEAPPPDDGHTLHISEAGAQRLAEIAERDGCTWDEAARRVLKYGAARMPVGWQG